jgi:hypothetical protein
MSDTFVLLCGSDLNTSIDDVWCSVHSSLDDAKVAAQAYVDAPIDDERYNLPWILTHDGGATACGLNEYFRINRCRMELTAEQIERAAIAIYMTHKKSPPIWETASSDVKDWFRRQVQAAIKELHGEGVSAG